MISSSSSQKNLFIWLNKSLTFLTVTHCFRNGGQLFDPLSRGVYT